MLTIPSSPLLTAHDAYLVLQVEEFVAPAADTVNAVSAWLKAAGLTAQTISPAGDWLSVSLPVSKANELLNAEFQVYTHANGKQAIRTLTYSVPDDLIGHVELVHPTIQ